MTSLGLLSSEAEAQVSPWVCFVSDPRFTFLAFRNEVSSGRHLRAQHSSKTRCFSLQGYRRWIDNEMELHQSKITFSHCKGVLRVQTLWYNWWENQQTGGPKLSSSDLDTSPSSPCFPYFPPEFFPWLTLSTNNVLRSLWPRQSH